MNKYFFIGLVLLLLVFSSGCTIFPDSTEVNVIVIESLEPIPKTVSPDQEIKFVVYVKNKGNEKKSVRVELYDYAEFFELEGSDKKTVELLPKQIEEITWKLTAKKLPLSAEAELKISATYEQKTTTLTTVKLIGYAEMQRRIAEGSFKKTDSEIKHDSGAVKAYIKIKDEQPIPVTGDNTIINTELVVENLGSGFVPEKKIEKGKIEINLPNDWSREEIKEDIVFIEKKVPTMPLKITAKTESIETEITENIITKVTYNYEIRKKTTVIINP